MAQRTTVPDVQELILDVDTNIPMVRFIRMAFPLVDWLESKDTEGQLTASLLKEIEANLAAHFYTMKDKQYSNKATGGASGAFQGQTGMGLDSSDFGQTAQRLDITGRLAQLDKDAAQGLRRVARVRWLGSCPPPDHTC
jgi:hypothetical protein